MSYQEMIKNSEVYDNFLSICPNSKKYLEYNIDAIPLRVIAENTGVEVNPDISYNTVPLSNKQNHLFRHSGDGDRFTVTILIKKDDTITGHFHDEYDVSIDDSFINLTGNSDIFNDPNFVGLGTTHKVVDYYDEFPLNVFLDYIIKQGIILSVVTRAIDIPNDLYVITGNDKRVQTYENSTIWELEFTRWTGATSVTWKTENAAAKKAISNYKKKKAKIAKAKAKAKTATSTKTKLKKCTKCSIKYSKTKKVCVCVKYVQSILKKKGFYKSDVDGWFGSKTLDAVKSFQRKYKKKYKLSVNGKVDAKTKNAICSV